MNTTKKRLFLFGLVLFSAWCVVGLSKLRFSYDIDRFFPQDDPALEHYVRHKAMFGDDINVLLIGLELPRALDSVSLRSINSLTQHVQALSFVEGVRSITNLGEPVRLPLGEWISVPFYMAPFANAKESTARLFKRTELRSLFVSGDTMATTLVVQLRPLTEVADRRSALQHIRHASDRTGMRYHLAGRLATQAHYVIATRTQLNVLGALALLLMVVVLLWTFRHPLTAFVPLMVSALALLWTFGPMGWLGVGIEPLLSLLPALLLVLGTSFSVHIISRFTALLQQHGAHSEAMRTALASTYRANLLCACSTAIGFGTLAFYPILPLHVFGYAAAWGILAALVASRLVVPLLAHKLKGRSVQRSDVQPHSRLAPVLRSWKWVIASTVFVLAAGCAVLPRLRVDNHFLDDLDRESELGRSATFFEERFSGTRPLEFTVVPAEHGVSVLDADVLDATDQLCRAIGQAFRVQRPLGPADAARTVMRGLHDGDRLPRTVAEVRDVSRVLQRAARARQGLLLVDSSARSARITGRIPDVGSEMFRDRMERLAPLLNNDRIRTTITSAAWLMDLANGRIAWIMVQGILSAILMNAVMIGFAVRSWRKGLISIVPNLVPMAFAALLMWFFQLPLKVGTAMIFPVLYGITMDDTIHFLMQQRHAERTGNPRSGHVRAWHHLRGALFNNTLVVSCGFALLGCSSFNSVAIFGLVTAVSLWMGLAADLCLMPILGALARRGRGG